MNNLRIVIAGGSGFIGKALAERWGGNNSVVVLSRQEKRTDQLPPYSERGICQVHWDGKSLGTWREAVDGCDLLINLAGKSVNCRYTPENKAAIFSSRLDSTRVLGEAVRAASKPPALWINASSATIYPNATVKPYDEYSPEREGDFSVQVVQAWEAAFNQVELKHTRKALLRTAIVLGDGGALLPYVRLARLGLGGKQGRGKQIFSWLHIEDFGRIIEWLWEHGEQEGVFNASAPEPLRNEQFMAMLRRFYGVHIGIPAPAALLKLVAPVVGTETELLLKSRWVLPRRLQQAGFVFSYPDLPTALVDLLRPKEQRQALRYPLLRFKRTDLLLQEVLGLLGLLALPFLGPAIILFGLGFWQLVSALFHYFRRGQFSLSLGRRRYNRSVVALFVAAAVLAGIALAAQSEAVMITLVWLMAAMLVTGPAMAIWYYSICRRELRNAGIDSSGAPGAGKN